MSAIEFYRGDKHPVLVTIKDSDGNAINITGYSFKLTVNENSKPTDETTQLFQVDGSIVDAANGQVQFLITDSHSNQTPGTYYYDVQMTTSGDAEIRTILKSSFEILQDITKS